MPYDADRHRADHHLDRPGARHTGIDGPHDGALRVRLAAPPVDHFFTGTPGRMRILAVVASLACLGFALSGFFALRALDSSVNRAAANTEQVVRVQQIYADLLRADAATTNGFLQGGLEPVDLRSTYDSAMARVWALESSSFMRRRNCVRHSVMRTVNAT